MSSDGTASSLLDLTCGFPQVDINLSTSRFAVLWEPHCLLAILSGLFMCETIVRHAPPLQHEATTNFPLRGQFAGFLKINGSHLAKIDLAESQPPQYIAGVVSLCVVATATALLALYQQHRQVRASPFSVDTGSQGIVRFCRFCTKKLSLQSALKQSKLDGGIDFTLLSVLNSSSWCRGFVCLRCVGVFLW